MTPPKDITEGEWSDSEGYVFSHYLNASIAKLEETPVPWKEQEANARMMAASKELAEALNDLLDNRLSLDDLLQKARAALIKSGYTPKNPNT